MQLLTYYFNKILPMTSLFVLMTFAMNYAINECKCRHHLCRRRRWTF